MGNPGTSSTRRVLLAYPRLPANQLVGFETMMPLFPGRRALMPPLGLLTFAGALPRHWTLRLVDENVRALTDADLAWADVVAVSGMHPQRRAIEALLERARGAGVITVLGGPSASVCPEYYPGAHAIHIGELGDATHDLVAWLEGAEEPPATQRVFRGTRRTPIEDVPLPRLDLTEASAYFTMPLQFSVGCPYACEFCDIPVIYGRRPRAKSPERVLRELQAIYDRGHLGAVVFVDDNLIARRDDLERLLPPLIAWQREHGYPFRVSTEASLDLVRYPHLLEGMREARITHVFFGVESTETETLVAISKRHNTRSPLLETLRTIQAAGIEALIGLILGFDTDTPEAARRIPEFVEAAHTPIVYFNLLTALPQTPLWTRLEAEGRLLPGTGGDTARADELLTCLESNIRYARPNEDVKRDLLAAIEAVYAPERVYARFRWNAEHVYGRQRLGRPPIRNLRELGAVAGFALGTVQRVFWKIGVMASYRRHFWRYLALLIRLRMRRRIGSVLEHLLLATPTAHHLITWAEELRRQVDEAASRRPPRGPRLGRRKAAPARAATPPAMSGARRT